MKVKKKITIQNWCISFNSITWECFKQTLHKAIRCASVCLFPKINRKEIDKMEKKIHYFHISITKTKLFNVHSLEEKVKVRLTKNQLKMWRWSNRKSKLLVLFGGEAIVNSHSRDVRQINGSLPREHRDTQRPLANKLVSTQILQPSYINWI